MFLNALRRAAAPIVITLAFLSNQVSAATVIDQAHNPDLVGGFTSAGDRNAQTFTVGTAGTLAGIEMRILDRPNVEAALNIEIRGTFTSFGTLLPNSPLLASRSIADDQIDTVVTNGVLVYIDFLSAGISVAVGDILAIVMTNSSAEYSWYLDAFEFATYTGGSRWEFDPPSWYLKSQADFRFRTYVDTGEPGEPGAVPEPATVGLVAMAGAAIARRRFAA